MYESKFCAQVMLIISVVGFEGEKKKDCLQYININISHIFHLDCYVAVLKMVVFAPYDLP